ncbi:MAG: LamG domain-containing protein [Nanoarchaeota archaeon]|nr:LamG domain-containing protein [Nanoarchaeota archaeon]
MRNNFRVGVALGLLFCAAMVFGAMVSANTISDNLNDKIWRETIRNKTTAGESNGEWLSWEKFKYYDPVERRLLITNSDDSIYLDSILTSSLDSHCGVGNDIKVAELRFVDFDIGGEGLIFDYDSYDIKKKYESKAKAYVLKYAVDSIVEDCHNVESFDNVTNISLGMETICYNQSRRDWIEFDEFRDLPHKDILVGVFTDTVAGENTEIIFKIGGFDIYEWSSYLADGLVSVYKLDETSGVIAYDELGINNLSNSGVAINQIGRIGTSYLFDASGDYLENTSAIGLTNVDLSGSIWVNLTGYNLYDTVLALYDSSANTANTLIFYDTSVLRFTKYSSSVSANIGIDFSSYFNKWTNIVWSINSTTMNLYLDGVLVNSTTMSFSKYSNNPELTIGNGDSRTRTRAVNGKMDEVIIWNRILNQTEISEVYDNWTYSSCSESIVNSSWSDWVNTTACLINDTTSQNRSLVEYDENFCGTYENVTYWDFQSASCDYCTPEAVNSSWSDWINITECFINDSIEQNRSLVEYDNNTCYEITSLPADEFTNTTYWDFANNSCDYCFYSIVNSSWSDWLEVSCNESNISIENRSLTEYDENYSTCYAVTGLETDLWNNGINITYFEQQEGICIFVITTIKGITGRYVLNTEYVEGVVGEVFETSSDLSKKYYWLGIPIIILIFGMKRSGKLEKVKLVQPKKK